MADVNYFKVSIVVQGGEHSGAIINMDNEPKVGDEIAFDGRIYAIIEIMELMPPIGDFGFLHATCRYLRDAN